MMISINAFSVLDLLAVIISTYTLVVFCYRSLRVTKRRIELLFTALVAQVWLEGILFLAVDNVVPANVAASSVPHASTDSLILCRLMYIVATTVMATITHFALRYTQSRHLPGWKVAWLYAGALAVIPLYFSEGFLAPRLSPLQETSTWSVAVPWLPISGPWSAVFVLLWLAVNVYVQWLFAQRPRSAVRGGLLDLKNFVWCGITLWGVGGLLSVIMAVSGYAGIDASMVFVTMAMVALAIGLAEDHLHAEAERKHVTRRFESYVDPALVKYVVDHPETDHIAGEVRELTVVFTDLEGFTAVSERLRTGAVTLLNEYLSLMVPLIRSHNGYRNKFLGDGMMFFYGAPELNPDHALHAVATVLKMQEMMVTFNELIAGRWKEYGAHLPSLAMRTGVSSGQMIVGDAGPADACEYTVLGDPVNLGARLESANKQLGTRILLSERTVDLISANRFVFQPVGRLQVVGLTRAVMTYEPLAQCDTATEQQKKKAALYSRVVERFIQSDFTRCLDYITEVEKELGSSKLTALYRDLSQRHRRNPPGAGFTGQIVLNEK